MNLDRMNSRWLASAPPWIFILPLALLALVSMTESRAAVPLDPAAFAPAPECRSSEAPPGPSLQGGTWTVAAPMSTERVFHCAVLLKDGRVLALGGLSGIQVLASAEFFNPGTGHWTLAAPMVAARYDFTATVFPDGRVLVAGGVGEDCATLDSVEIYTPESDSWSAAAPMTVPRFGHAAALTEDGKVLMAGGGTSRCALPSPYLTSAEIFDPASGTWTPTGNLNGQHGYPSMDPLPGGKFLLVGGFYEPGKGFACEIYFPEVRSWLMSTGSVSNHILHQSARLPDGKVLVAGGLDYNAGAEIFDPVRLSWASTEPSHRRRMNAAAVSLPGGRVLVAGGYDQETDYGLASAELYDPVARCWAYTGSMHRDRGGHTATLMPDGRVLVAGGYTSQVELYEPFTGCIFGCAATVPASWPEGVPATFHSEPLLSSCEGQPEVYWDFGDGATSSEPNPSHTYAQEGMYTWTVSLTLGQQTCEKTGVIEATSTDCRMDCGLEPGYITVLVDTPVAFHGYASPTSFCTATPTCRWDFGDGTTSTEFNPVHSFTLPGTHEVHCLFSIGGVTCTASTLIYIELPPPPVFVSGLVKGNPFRLDIRGENFQKGIRVFINGIEWTNVSWKGVGRIVLRGGAALKRLFPKRTPTEFRFLNPDRGESTYVLRYG